MQISDKKLISLYRKGDVQALESLVERYRGRLFGYIMSMTGCTSDADEVFQETWFRVIKSIDRYRDKAFAGWLFRIARNMVIDTARRRRPDFSIDQLSQSGVSHHELMAGSSGEPGENVANIDLGKRIKRAVDALPLDQREVFMLRNEAGLAFKEIAAVQGVSINTALARMQYAVGRLRKELSDDYNELS